MPDSLMNGRSGSYFYSRAFNADNRSSVKLGAGRGLVPLQGSVIATGDREVEQRLSLRAFNLNIHLHHDVLNFGASLV
ncbi:hypothetical protein J2Y68_003122 [Paenarthrobacter nitroguajacolicus]|nr:hypothetical protein [Paenarthrobacter nitroguajacolicus]